MLKILSIPHNNIAYKSGLRNNDIIVRFGEQPALDMLDVAYYDCQEKFDITVMRGDKEVVVHIDKPAYMPLEWEFYEQCYIEPRWCANKCLFCFVDQLPKGQRETLYVKDDDWRLSFVSGNYVTLSNISDKELDRICNNKYSPLYISVHATQDDMRRTLLGNPKARSIMDIMRRLADSGITMHTQVVLAPDYNDRDVLQQTMQDLYSLYPYVATLAVVPVGLTGHRENLPAIKCVTEQLADHTIDMVESFDAMVYQKHNQHFVYCSDEMYIYSSHDIPSYEYYGDFEQIENGIGLVADLRYQFDLAFVDAIAHKNTSMTIITGQSAAPFMQELVNKAKDRFAQCNVNVVSIVNEFFGSSVTVAGLVVGGDIVRQISNRTDIGDTLLLPRVMLREIEDVFLDGMTLSELKTQLNKDIIIVADGYELCQAILECD